MFADEEPKKPEVLGVRNLTIAVALHVSLFLLAYLFAKVSVKPKETTIPIDLTVVVHENLDGNEDEPPPLSPPEPTPPPSTQPKAKPVDRVETPPKVDAKVDAVVKTHEKTKPKPPPKEVKPKPEKPKKTAEQLRKETEERERKRLEEIRNRGRIVKAPTQKPPKERQPNGRTGKALTRAEIAKRLNEGYRPGAVNSIADTEQQRCISLIRRAFYDKWDRPPTDRKRVLRLSIQLGSGGRVLGCRLAQGSGDAAVDASALRAASRIKIISGLSSEFISQNKELTIQVELTPQ